MLHSIMEQRAVRQRSQCIMIRFMQQPRFQQFALGDIAKDGLRGYRVLVRDSHRRGIDFAQLPVNPREPILNTRGGSTHPLLQ